MATPSPKMGLVLPVQQDKFSTADIRGNWEKIDAAPGTHICTSTTRPTGWGAAQAGRKIIETNTGIEYRWTGSAWSRTTGGSGILRRDNGTLALVQKDTNSSTTSTTFKKVLSMSGVIVPDGNRPLMVFANWQQADNNTGPFLVALFQSNVDNSGTVLGRQFIAPGSASRGPGGNIIAFIKEGLNAGTYDFSLQFRSIESVGGTSNIYADATTQQVQLAVIEL